MIERPWWKEPTRSQWAAFAAAWSGWVLDAFDFMIYILVAKQIAAEFDVSRVAVMGSVTLPLVIRLAGGAIAGWMADRFGRKYPLLLSLIWLVGFDAAIYFSDSFTAILVFRALFGLGMGAQWTAGTSLAMESLPERTRKIGSGLLQAGWPLGVILAALCAHYVVDETTWRPMFLIGIIPALLTTPLWFMFPNTRPAPRHAVAASQQPTAGVPRMIVLGSIVMALGFIVYYGLQASYPLMLQTELRLQPSEAMELVMLFNIGMLVGVIAAGAVASRWGVTVAMCAPALLMVPALPLYIGMAPGLLGVGAVLGGALGVGYSGVTPVLTTSLFPAHVRARAIAIVYHVGALVGGLTPLAMAQLGETYGWPLSTMIAWITGGALVLMVALIISLRRRLILDRRAPITPASSSALHPPASVPAYRAPSA
jgi:MFS transporter, SHS family, lactate transporter